MVPSCPLGIKARLLRPLGKVFNDWDERLPNTHTFWGGNQAGWQGNLGREKLPDLQGQVAASTGCSPRHRELKRTPKASMDLSLPAASLEQALAA